MRKIIFIILACCFPVWVFAQARTFSVTIDPQQIQNGYFITRVPLAHYAVPEINVHHTVYKTIKENGIVPGNSHVDVKLGKELKQPFALLYIPVFKQAENGLVQQLITCEVTLTESGTPEKHTQKTTALNSVLASGNWYKVAIKERGIYKMDYNFIKDKLGVDPATVSPANIRVYGNGGVMLSENNAVSRATDLMENAIQVVGGGDGVFNTGDYIIFYASGPMGWDYDPVTKTFVHKKNLYSDSSYYFINFDLGAGKRVGTIPAPGAANVTVTAYNDYQVHEEDLVNLGHFGKVFWGEFFGQNNGGSFSQSFNFNLGNPADTAVVKFHLGSRALVSGNTMDVKINGQTYGSAYFPALGGGDYQYAYEEQYVTYKIPSPVSSQNVTLQYNSASTGIGYLDYIEWNTRRHLQLDGGMITFRDATSVGAGNVAKYELQNANSNTVVWDVTDPLQPSQMNGSLAGTTFSFNQNADALHEFAAFDGSTFLTPVFTAKVENQNLHGAGNQDLLIVTYPSFTGAANQLATHHRQHDGMNVLVATTEQVYNEFSSGSQDLSAIRDFAKYFYDNAGEDTASMPKYLLLLGDASYDYKDIEQNNTNFVPTYETAESRDPLISYCSDDLFSFLDDNENIEDISIANTMDISVGRLPVGSAEEAMKVADKIINYTNASSLGPWRLSTTLLSDNEAEGESGNVHLLDAEIMAATINQNTDLYNETKVYLSAIPVISTPGGARAPEANKMINDQIFKGTFLMNYNGHGSIYTLTSERVVTQDDYSTWKNIDKLPIMVTATCDFSKYDDPTAKSSGEKIIVKEDGGAVALLTTTQLVYQYQNQQMNRQFLNALFQQYNGKWPTLGDAFRMSKNVTYISTGEHHNFRKFVLLGDPALTAAFPKHKVVTDSLLDGYTGQPVDSMKALGLYELKGSVKDVSGNILNDFNGRVYVSIYDKPKTVATISGTQRTFQVQNNLIFKGKASVTNGHFSISFVTPKDLNYDFGKGKISYYTENGQEDGAGVDTNIVIGGVSDKPITDNKGPQVTPYINDSLFVNGGITGANTLLFVKLYDEETGINVSGNAIGHDLTAVLDGDVAKPYTLNDYYESAANDYRRGYVNFPITGLSDGKHTLTVKAWDMNNNSGEGSVDFIVVNGKVMQVENLMNYPNPFSDKTYFVFSHNHPDEDLIATIRIYNTTGSLVRTIRQEFTANGSRSAELSWDGTSETGAKLPAGLYVYRLNIATQKGIQASAYQKLILLR